MDRSCAGGVGTSWVDKTANPPGQTHLSLKVVAHVFIKSRDGGFPSFLIALRIPRNPEFNGKVHNNMVDKNCHINDTSDPFLYNEWPGNVLSMA